MAEPRGPLGDVLRQPLTSLCARYIIILASWLMNKSILTFAEDMPPPPTYPYHYRGSLIIRDTCRPCTPNSLTYRTSPLPTRYLAHEKRRRRALDPVAHFHLHNGASIWRLNWLGDLSPSGLQRSYGLMANYQYHLPDMARNSNEYHMNGTAALSDSLQGYL